MNESKFVNFNLRELSFIIRVWFEWDGSRLPMRGEVRIRFILDQINRPINAKKCQKILPSPLGGGPGQSGIQSSVGARLWGTEDRGAWPVQGDISIRRPHCQHGLTHDDNDNEQLGAFCSGRICRRHRQRYHGESSRRYFVPPRLQPISRLHPRRPFVWARVRLGALQRLTSEGQLHQEL